MSYFVFDKSYIEVDTLKIHTKLLSARNHSFTPRGTKIQRPILHTQTSTQRMLSM